MYLVARKRYGKIYVLLIMYSIIINEQVRYISWFIPFGLRNSVANTIFSHMSRNFGKKRALSEMLKVLIVCEYTCFQSRTEVRGVAWDYPDRAQ